MIARAEPAATTLVESWWAKRQPARPKDPATITVLRTEVLRPGRPGLLDVVADVGGRRAHLVAGLRAVGESPTSSTPARRGAGPARRRDRAGRLHRCAA